MKLSLQWLHSLTKRSKSEGAIPALTKDEIFAGCFLGYEIRRAWQSVSFLATSIERCFKVTEGSISGKKWRKSLSNALNDCRDALLKNSLQGEISKVPNIDVMVSEIIKTCNELHMKEEHEKGTAREANLIDMYANAFRREVKGRGEYEHQRYNTSGSRTLTIRRAP